METTNPAGRLHAILTRAKEVGASGRVDSALMLWGMTFDVEGNAAPQTLYRNQAIVISRLLQFAQLIDETEATLKAIDGIPDRYFRPFERIRHLSKQSLFALSTDVRSQLNQVTEGDMTVLEFCSEKLESFHREAIVDDGELENILAEVTELFDHVKTTNTESDLKTFILDGLETIRRGIYEFRIRGPERLKETIGEIIGDYAVNHPKPQTPEERESWAKFNNSFRRFVSVVSYAHTGIKYLQAGLGGSLLPGASSD